MPSPSYVYWYTREAQVIRGKTGDLCRGPEIFYAVTGIFYMLTTNICQVTSTELLYRKKNRALQWTIYVGEKTLESPCLK